MDRGTRYTFISLLGSELCFSWYLFLSVLAFFPLLHSICAFFCVFLACDFLPDTFAYFLILGEQIRILACLSAYKQDIEIITPFKVAAVMNKNGIGESLKKQNGNTGGETNAVSQIVDAGSDDQDNQSGEVVMKGKNNSNKDVSAGESLLRMEDHKRQTKQLLQRFKDSHFFARIAESNETLWSKRRDQEEDAPFEEKVIGDSSETATATKKKYPMSAEIDRGEFDTRTSGGLARGAVKCCSLTNGDIVVCNCVS